MNNTPAIRTASPADDRLPLLLLLGVSFFYGFALVLWYVSANTFFLLDWGAERLPWVFIGVALFVSTFSYGITELQKHWSVARIVLTIELALVVCTVLFRVGLVTPFSHWISLLFMITFFLGFQMGFIVIGLLAGQLFNIRQIKRLVPVVMGCYNSGFVLGGFLVPLLVKWVGTTHNLLFILMSSFVISLLFMLVLMGKFPAQLARAASTDNEAAPKPLLQLLRQRYTARTFGYQMLSAIGSQLTLFILLIAAESQFSDANALANFFGTFAGARNVVNVLFGLLVAGWLLNRFGLSFGLAANPVGVGLLVALMAGSLGFDGGALFFWLAVIAVGLDVVLSESITMPALKTVYQAMPARDRQRVEMAVEGIGVPLAFGVAGVILLILNAIPGLSLTHLVLFTLVMLVPWLLAGMLLYRDYAGALLRTLSRRALGAAELALEDQSSLAVVDRLLRSSNLGEVCLALDILERAEHPALDAKLIELVNHDEAVVRSEALERIARLRITAAAPVVERCLAPDYDPATRGAALQAFCALLESDVVERVRLHLDASEPAIRRGALVGLLRYGGIPGILAAGEHLTEMEQKPDPMRRLLVAQVIGAVGMNSFYQPLLPLLADGDVEVRRAALTAATRVHHPRLLTAVIDNLNHADTRSAAMNALTASGELVLPLVNNALLGDTGYNDEMTRRLVRVCGQIKSERVVAMLKRHLDHPNSELQHQVLLALHLCGYRAEGDDVAHIRDALYACARHGMRLLLTRQEIAAHEAATPLHAALDDELVQVRRRVLLMLSFLYNAQALLRVEEQLASSQASAKAFAIETLDVTLSGEQKALVLPLVDESVALSQRVNALGKQFTLPRLQQHERLAEIIADTGVWTQGWTRACAIYAAGKLALSDLTSTIRNALSFEQQEAPIQETASWALVHLRDGGD